MARCVVVFVSQILEKNKSGTLSINGIAIPATLVEDYDLEKNTLQLKTPQEISIGYQSPHGKEYGSIQYFYLKFASGETISIVSHFIQQFSCSRE